MSDNFLLDAVNKLRDENRAYTNELIVAQIETNQNLSDLGDTVGDFLEQFKGSRLDAEEARRDSARGNNVPAAEDTRPESEEPEFGLKGILQILAGIGAAVAGFATGLVQGFARIFKMVLKPLNTRLMRFVKPVMDFITRVGKSIRAFTRAATLAFAIRFPETTKKLLEGFDKARKFLSKTSTDFVKNFNRVITNLKNAFTAGTNGVRGIARGANGAFRSLNIIERMLNVWGKTTGKFASDAKKLFSNSFKAVKDGINNFLKPIKNVINGIRGVGQSTSVMGKTLRAIFSGFRTIGRFIAFPLTVIMTIIDAFKGMVAGADRQIGMTDKIIGGFFGALGGIVKGIIGMPLDLLKSAVSWIAGKLGFEDAEKYLDSFKFVDIIGDIFNGIADFFVDIGNRVKIFFNKIGGNLLDPIKKLWNGEGSVLTNIRDILSGFISSVVGFPLDLIKGVVSSVLKLFGVKNNLDEFSFMDTIQKGYNAIFDFIGMVGVKLYDFFASLGGRIIDSLKQRFNSVIEPLTNLFNGRGSFLENIYELVKNLYTSIISFPLDLVKDVVSSVLGMLGFEDAEATLDSFSFQDTFGQIIDWVTALPGKLVDGLMSILNGDLSVSDILSNVTDMGTRFNEWLKGLIRQPLADIATSDSWLDKGLKAIIPDGVFDWAGVDADTGKITAPKVDRPEVTERSGATQQMEQTQKENADMKAQQGGVNVVAPMSNVTNNNNSSTTAAVMDNNLPTVDTNARTYYGLEGGAMSLHMAM